MSVNTKYKSMITTAASNISGVNESFANQSQTNINITENISEVNSLPFANLHVKSKKIADLSELKDFFKMQNGAIQKALSKFKAEKMNEKPVIIESEATSYPVTANGSSKKPLLVTAAKRIYRKGFEAQSPMIIESFTPHV